MVVTAVAGWRLVDRLLAAYGVVVALIGVSRWSMPGIHWVVAAHLALPLIAWLAASAPETPVLRAIRALYPVVVLSALYSAIEIINRFGAAPTFDRQIQHIDQLVFGMQPSRDWWRKHPSAFWSTLLHADYLAYYLIVIGPVLWLLALRKSVALERYLNGLLATYLVCYLFYILLPVAGPYYEFARPTGAFIANVPAQWVYAALRGGSAFGAAFPSSHVAATVAATIGAWHASRRMGMVLLAPTALLLVAVVYCQMHYAFDSAAGLVVGVVVATIATRQPVITRA